MQEMNDMIPNRDTAA